MPDFFRLFIVRWLPACLLVTVIYVASSTPDYDLINFGLLDILIKKGGHVLGYFLLTLTLLRGLGRLSGKFLLSAVFFTLMYAVFDEFHQSFVTGRHAAVTDVLIDMTGSLLAVWGVGKFTTLRKWVLAGLGVN